MLWTEDIWRASFRLAEEESRRRMENAQTDRESREMEGLEGLERERDR